MHKSQTEVIANILDARPLNGQSKSKDMEMGTNGVQILNEGALPYCHSPRPAIEVSVSSAILADRNLNSFVQHQDPQPSSLNNSPAWYSLPTTSLINSPARYSTLPEKGVVLGPVTSDTWRLDKVCVQSFSVMNITSDSLIPSSCSKELAMHSCDGGPNSLLSTNVDIPSKDLGKRELAVIRSDLEGDAVGLYQ